MYIKKYLKKILQFSYFLANTKSLYYAFMLGLCSAMQDVKHRFLCSLLSANGTDATQKGLEWKSRTHFNPLRKKERLKSLNSLSAE